MNKIFFTPDTLRMCLKPLFLFKEIKPFPTTESVASLAILMFVEVEGKVTLRMRVLSLMIWLLAHESKNHVEEDLGEFSTMQASRVVETFSSLLVSFALAMRTCRLLGFLTLVSLSSKSFNLS